MHIEGVPSFKVIVKTEGLSHLNASYEVEVISYSLALLAYGFVNMKLALHKIDNPLGGTIHVATYSMPLTIW